MTQDLDHKSRVRLSLPQFWGIIVAVASATFVVASGLFAIRGEQMAIRSDFASSRQMVQAQIATITNTLAEVKTDRSESKRELTGWRSQVDQTNVRQDAEIHQLQSERRTAVRLPN